MAWSLKDLFYISPEDRKEMNRHREEMSKQRVNKIKARHGKPDDDDEDAPAYVAPLPPPESGGLGDFIEDNPVLSFFGAMGAGALTLMALKKVM